MPAWVEVEGYGPKPGPQVQPSSRTGRSSSKKEVALEPRVLASPQMPQTCTAG